MTGTGILLGTGSCCCEPAAAAVQHNARAHNLRTPKHEGLYRYEHEKALPRSEDELEEETGAIQPFNRLGCSPIQLKMNKMNSFEQHAGWSRCSMKKKSWLIVVLQA